MQPIIYDVAVSLDGFISGPDGDISKFPADGPIVEAYLARLRTYAIAIMGKATYEFGYAFGMSPGDNPYPNMKTFVFSKTMNFPRDKQITVVRNEAFGVIRHLKETEDGPIYLCGGGDFAGSLLSEGLIDIVRMKRAPIILGGGVKLFGDHTPQCTLVHRETKTENGGYIFQEFQVETEAP